MAARVKTFGIKELRRKLQKYAEEVGALPNIEIYVDNRADWQKYTINRDKYNRDPFKIDSRQTRRVLKLIVDSIAWKRLSSRRRALLEKAGEMARDYVKHNLQAGRATGQPNAPSTVKRKGHNKLMYDKGDLYRSIKSRLKK